MVSVLRFTDVSVVRDRRAILAGVDWTVSSDERWVILGPNGAGKTSLLRLASAQEFPTRGQVEVLGHRLGRVDVFELRSRVGFAGTTAARRLPPEETVRDAVLTAGYAIEGRWREHYDAIDLRQADRVLAEWQLDELAERRFGTLSDGERQRATIARAVMTDPELLLLDEPTASLDLGARERLIRMLGGFAQAPNSPAMVMVTHHVEEIPPGFTHLLLLREGRIVSAGPLDEVLTAEALGETFGGTFELSHRDGRYAAIAAA